jgi:hypothetical protein
MFIGDVHPLQTIDLLNLINQVFLHLVISLNPQYIVGVNGALTELLSGDHIVIVLHLEMLTLRNKILAVLHLAVNNYAALTLGETAKLHRPINLGDYCRVLGASGFKELGNAG